MTDIREQIDRLRNSRVVWKDARRAPTDLEAEAADTMEKMLARNELLEAVYEAAKFQIEMLDGIDSTAKSRTLLKALAALEAQDE